MNIIQNTIHKSHKKDRLNILSMPFIGEFEYSFVDNFGHILCIIDDHKKISEFCEKNPKPSRITFFPAQNNDIKVSKLISFDLMIVNGRNYYELAEKLYPFYQIPIIIIEHDIPNLKRWQIKNINRNIISKNPAAIININLIIHKHWNEIGIVLTEKEQWQKLLFQITKGGFNENICDL